MKRIAYLVAVAITLTLFVTACGSSGSSSPPSSSGSTASSSGSTAAAPASGAASGGNLVIGLECSCTGEAASSTATAQPALNAWAASVNANGGVDGHHVQIITLDDAFNPGTSVAQVQKLISDDHVVAIVDGSDVDSGWGTVVQQAGVPVIGANLSSTFMFTNPDFFPQGQTDDSLAYALAFAAAKAGAKKMGVMYCAEQPACAQLAPLVKSAVGKVGISYASSIAVSASASNYTAECLAMQQSGADAVWVSQASAVVQSVAASCHQQGYNPTYIEDDGSVATAWATAPGLDGTVSVQPDIPFDVAGTPAAQSMRAAFSQYAPQLLNSANFGEVAVESYISGLLVEAAAKAGGLSATPTPAELLKGLYSLKAEDLGGLAPSLTFSSGKPNKVDCFFLQRIENGKFTEPYGTQTFCES
jgi:branched-chain amino acid transport system substrate-binding protein